MFSQNISQTDYISNPIIKNGDIYSVELPFAGAYIHWYTDTNGVYMEQLSDNSAKMHYLEYGITNARLYAELQYNNEQIGGSWIAITTPDLEIIGTDNINCCDELLEPNLMLENAQYEWTFSDNIDYVKYPDNSKAYVSTTLDAVGPLNATLKVTTMNGNVHQATKSFEHNVIDNIELFVFTDLYNHNRKAFNLIFGSDPNIEYTQRYRIAWNIVDSYGNPVDKSQFDISATNAEIWKTLQANLIYTPCPSISIPAPSSNKIKQSWEEIEEPDEPTPFNPIDSQVAGLKSKAVIIFPTGFSGKVICTVQTDCNIFFKEEYPINSASYKISPNPSKDKTIHIIRNGCSDNTSNDEITVNIYDNSSLVKSTTVRDSESMTINAEELRPGTYHIILSKGNNKLHSQTIIISD
jgi:hypothetical protein